jgi:hypothetical protein
MIMAALAAGTGGEFVYGTPPDDKVPFAVWGQVWLSMRIIPKALADGRPFWHIDNGFYLPARGTPTGYYRMTYCSPSPIRLDWHPEMEERISIVSVKPWREDGDHVLLAYPGVDFGLAFGFNCQRWIDTAYDRIRAATNRKVILRSKTARRPLANDLHNCWALVTHSSNVAVDAVLAGIPVVVARSSPAAPVGRITLDIEDPVMPDRGRWLGSLLSQQFTLDEMRSGIAAKWMARIKDQVDFHASTHQEN